MLCIMSENDCPNYYSSKKELILKKFSVRIIRASKLIGQIRGGGGGGTLFWTLDKNLKQYVKEYQY